MESDDHSQILLMKTVLEAENGDDDILRALKRLSKVRMTVDLLQNTGIGKVVNQFRKRDGPVGPFAKALVNKWKQDVAKLIAEAATAASPARKRSVSPETERNVKRARTSPEPTEEPDISSPKSTEDTRTRLSFADYMRDKDRGTSSRSGKDSGNKEKHRSSSHGQEKQDGRSRDAISPRNDDEHSGRHQNSGGERSRHGGNAHSGESKQREKSEHDKAREKYRQDKSGREKSEHVEGSREKSKHVDGTREKSKHGESEHSREKSNHGESSREKSAHCESSSKSKHGVSSREKSKHGESSREKSRHGESSREKSKHSESSRDKSKHREHEGSSREKSKHSESSREKSKHGESSREKSKHGDDSKERSKNGESSREKSKHGGSSREKSKHRESSREKSGHSDNYKTERSREKSEKHGETLPSSEMSTGSESDRTGRKRITERRSTLPQFHIPTPQQQTGLHEADILASLPQTATNYRPLPRLSQDSPSKLRPSAEEVGVKKHSRSVMYSGRKTRTLQEVPTLFDACLEILMDNIDSIDCVGSVPYFVLKPVLLKCTPEQLYNIENINTHLLEDTDELWADHCKKDFRGRIRNTDDCESWRELYLRLHEEREHKLKKLTANISAQHSALKDAGRKTKLAFVETIAKPPRDVLRRQKMHGTGGPVHKTVDPLERLSSRGGQPGKSSIRAPIMKNQLTNHIVSPPVVRPSAGKKPTAAPMMANAMKMMKKMRR